MEYKIITPPDEEPVSLAEAKVQCKVEHNADDALLAIYINAACEKAEHITGRKFVTQTAEMVLDVFPSAEIKLPVTPVQSIKSIKYIDTDGNDATVSELNYALDNYGLDHLVVPISGYSWPSNQAVTNAVKVQFVVGYGSPADVPSGIKSWILLTIETLYKNRGAVTEAQNYDIPSRFCDSLLDKHRVWSV